MAIPEARKEERSRLGAETVFVLAMASKDNGLSPEVSVLDGS